MERFKETIVVVDDSATILAMVKETLSDKYDVLTIATCAELINILEIVSPELILLDVEMPEMDGYDVIKAVKGKIETEHIPVVFLTSRVDPESELQALNLGAVDYIHKPFTPSLLSKRVELHLLLDAQKREIKDLTEDLYVIIGERTEDMLDLNNAIQRAFAEAAESRDSLSGALAAKMQAYLTEEAERIVRAGDSIRFAPKPAAICKKREQEFRIVLQSLLKEEE
jgi:putative two-component system response regulator